MASSISSLYDHTSDVISGKTNEAPGFSSLRSFPGKNGFSTRQSSVPSNRDAALVRNMVRWFVPETGIVEMYINPKSIKYNEKKQISSQRTRNGFVLQYWGEDLPTLSIGGTTGTSGIEGINVLRDIYLNEQLSMDPLALAVQAQLEMQAELLNPSSVDFVQTLSEGFLGAVGNTISSGNVNPTKPKPTLASMAFSVEMYWSGWVFRGYFTSFNVTEEATNLGMFDYSLEFTVTQRRGLRLNFMPWHRSPVDGPSRSGNSGIEYSFGGLQGQDRVTQNPGDLSNTTTQKTNQPLNKLLLSDNSLIQDVKK